MGERHPEPATQAARRHVVAVTSAWAAGEPPAGGLLINLGPAHPSAHGMLRLNLTLAGDRITAAEPVIGFVHRGAEKLFEARDFRQIIVLANRHDWLGSFASELGVVLAAERLAGIEVPPRAVWARTLLAELNRVLSHLAFLGSYPPEIAAADAGEPCGCRCGRRAHRVGHRAVSLSFQSATGQRAPGTALTRPSGTGQH